MATRGEQALDTREEGVYPQTHMPTSGTTPGAGYGTGTGFGNAEYGTTGTTTSTYGTSGTTGLGTTSGLGGAGTYAKVILTIKSAHNMKDKAWLGKSDPYCVVKCGDAEIQTQHVKNAGENVTWDESFAFSNVSPDDVIEFHVYDYNRILKDAHMGEGSISLRQAFEEGRLETRVPLTSRSGTKDCGEIWISLRKEGGADIGTTGTGLGTTSGLGTTGLETTGTTGYAERDVGYTEGTTTTTTTTTGLAPVAGVETTGTTAAVGGTGEVVCSQEYFTKVEDRPVIKERVTVLREHRPVEKEYVVETRATGVERETGVREAEHMGTTAQVVAEAPPTAPCE